MRKVVRANLVSLAACVPEGRKGPLVLKLTVEVNGRATLAEVNLASETGCVREAIKGWKFPHPGSPVQITWPVKPRDIQAAVVGLLSKLVGTPEGISSRDVLQPGTLGTVGLGRPQPQTELSERPEARAPRGVLRFEAPSVDGLNPEAVQRILFLRQNPLRSCFDNVLKANPTAQGKVVLHLEVNASGRPARIEVQGDTVGDAQLPVCLKAQVSRLVFPSPPDGSARVRVALVFTSENTP